MIRLGVHWDSAQQEEWVVLRVRANWLQWAHGAAYYGTKLLVPVLAMLPITPIDVRMIVHDALEPRLRRACEARPSKWVPQ